MLRNFLYLNTNAVDSYLAVIEGGLADSATRRVSEKGTRSGKGTASLAGVGASIGRDREASEEAERVVRETPEQRFDRLMLALAEDPDRYDYEEVMSLADSFHRCKIGAMVSVQCDVEIPEMIRLLAQPDQVGQMLDLMDAMRPLAGFFGSDTEGMPTAEETDAVRRMTAAINSDLVFVGDTDMSGPRVVGKLERDYLREVPEDEVVVVGKVSKRWLANESFPVLALPGASIMTRAQRREMQRSGGDADGSMLEGPALTLDVVAIFR